MRRRLATRALAAALAASLLAAAAPAHEESPRRNWVVRAVERVGPAVVNITTEQDVVQRPRMGGPFDRFFRDFFEPRIQRRASSLGSGIVIDAERHVLTNEHVIARANRIRVTLEDGREFDAQLVGADPNNDLAVLKLKTEEAVPYAAPASSNELLVGEPVLAIGNPFGFSNTVTTGVLSAVDRSLRTEDRVYHGFIQTDASINPGNSGGPLLNAEGDVIGINTAIYGGAQGIGFAIPIDTARRIVRELITRGEIAPVWIGLDLQDLDPRLLEALELPPTLRGALVSRVRLDGPAARGGIERGDVVTRVDGRSVRSAREVYEVLERSTPGQQLALGVHRNGFEREVRVRSVEIDAGELFELGQQILGMEFEPAERGGWVVTAVRGGSGAARIGIEPGDRVLAVNGKALGTREEARRVFLDLRGRTRALVVVQRGRGRYHLTLPLR